MIIRWLRFFIGVITAGAELVREPGPAQGPGSRAASVQVLVALGKEQSLAGWQPHSQTGQVSGCGVEPILPGK